MDGVKHQSILKVSKSNSVFYMQLYAGISNDLNKIFFSYMKGFNVFINGLNESFYYGNDRPVEVSAGFETKIHLKRMIFSHFPKPYSNCSIEKIVI